MAETGTTTDTQNTPQNETPNFSIITQYIKDQSFENPNPVHAFLTQHETQPNISVDISAKATKVGENLFEVILDINTKATFSESQTLFMAVLSYGALVNLNETQIPSDVVPQLLMIHTPTMLFPFARAIISDMTREGGFPALTLHPVDFQALYQAHQQQAEAQQRAAS